MRGQPESYDAYDTIKKYPHDHTKLDSVTGL